MKYLVRAIKYFFYFAFLTSVIIGALVLVGVVEGNIDTMFRGGWNAIWKMMILFAVVASVYPKVGFIKREAVTGNSWDAIRNDFTAYMRERHYDLESDDDKIVTFRYRGVAGKFSRMYEDRITIDVTTEGVLVIEGLRKDVLRIAMGAESRFRKED